MANNHKPGPMSRSARSNNRQRKDSKEGQLAKTDLPGILADIITKAPAARAYRPFPYTYHCVVDRVGSRLLLLEESNRTVRYVDLQHMVSSLTRYIRETEPRLNSGVKAYEMADCARFTLSAMAPLDCTPSLISFQSEPGLAFMRHPFDPVPSSRLEVCPTYAELLGRMTNANAFAMRIGSIFDQDADRKQAVWLYGPPDCGKSQVQVILEFLAGDAFRVLSGSDLGTRFWKEALIGGRVLVLPEARAKFLSTPEFKALTGDKTHSIDRKGEKIFRAELQVLLFFISNELPDIGDDSAVNERLVPCELTPFQGSLLPESQYQAKLKAEFPAFVSYCVALYQTVRGARIPCTRVDSLGLLGDPLSDFKDFFEREYVRDPGGHVAPSELRRKMQELRPMSPHEFKQFNDYLYHEYGARKVRPASIGMGVEGEERRPRYISGIRPRRPRERPHSFATNGSDAST